MTDTDLFRAYSQTTFVADVPEGVIEIRVNRRNPELDEVLAQCGSTTWGFVTAWNPGSVPLSLEENRRRQATLVRATSEMCKQTWPGRGVPDAGDWIPEESLLVADLTADEALRLGRRFGQLAVVWGEVGHPARLLSCSA